LCAGECILGNGYWYIFDDINIEKFVEFRL